MTRTVRTTPKPLPTPLAMSAAPNEPTPSPLPIRPKEEAHLFKEEGRKKDGREEKVTSRPHPKPTFPTPKLRLSTLDLDHPGSNVFFSNTNPSKALSEAVDAVLSILYQPTKTNDHIPACRSVTLCLHAMGGVAYTTGSDLDGDHKEIHFSLDYINGIPSARQKDEVQGVLVHEMVHCWQWNAVGTAPGGLIEGIADFVRLKAGLSPPHWKKEGGGQWDAGYQHTGYFLEWIESTCGRGSVRKINHALKDKKYAEDDFWEQLFGKNVSLLWKEYEGSLDEEQKMTKKVESSAESHEKDRKDNAEMKEKGRKDGRSEGDESVEKDKPNDNLA
ncbi:hypothetical protein HO173_002666 [Letharia columbiana]|uniref:Uncharacterized protein n=1 Tax=Letharia columbiana TaxID=112416 RepID=A0A8H6G2U8_9LECA|nr:uncharacterized protein HO173_002666 [Letharia columbiana]KAF6239404.1 hypothetical protein HO173_002666 [Letharia columbiana]